VSISATEPVGAQNLRILPWIAAIAFFMQMLDSTILNTALPAIAEDLDVSPLRTHAVVIAYTLTAAVLIPASGWLADRFGARTVFLWSIAVFTLGSLTCALSSSLEMLVASRVLQGVGGALLIPVGRLSILRAFPRDQLVRVLSFVTVPGLLGPLLGPVLGGMFVHYASWHWIFLINIPVGLAGMLLTRRHMPDYKDTGPRHRFDWLGYLLFILFMLSVTFSLEGPGTDPLPRALRIALFVFGLASLFGYGLYSLKAANPLFNPALFKTQNFRVGILGNLLSRFGTGALPFLTPLILQVGLDHSPIKAGLTMLPLAIGGMLAKGFVDKLITALGYRRFLVGNTLLVSLMLAAYAFIDASTPYAWILIVFFLAGVFNSLQFTGMNTLSLVDLPDAHAADGNSLLSVVMQLSIGMGVALAAAFLDIFTSAGQSALHSLHYTFLALAALNALSALIFIRAESTGAHILPDQ